MRLDVPLLPISVEVRWRRLPPSRVTLRGLMIGVVVAGLLFALAAHLGRLNRAMQYHSERASLAAQGRKPAGLAPASGPSPLESWHSAMAGRYRSEFDRIDVLSFVISMTFAALAIVAAFGRVVDWSRRRPRTPAEEGPMAPRPISPVGSHPKPEEP